jgi:hypothetical protein
VLWQDLSIDWQMSCAILIAIATMMLGLKIVAAIRPLRVTEPRSGPRLCEPRQSERPRDPRNVSSARSLRFLLSPMLAPNSLERARPLSALPAYLLRGAACLGALLLFYWAYWKVVNAFHLRGVALSYLSAGGVLLMTETIAFIVILLWLPSGRLLPVPHHNPFAARTVGDFRGRRWDLWMSDWFRFAMFTPMRRRPVLAVWLVFFVSGVLHEYVLNLTLWIVTGRKLFGSMMLYFLLQGAGVLAERSFLKEQPRANRLFTWLVVLGPAPLVLHESMLRALHLWVE